MQVKDLITFYINDSSNTLDVSFRLETDGEEEIRNDSILIETVSEFGYDFLNEQDDFEDEDEDMVLKYYMEDSILVEEDDVISFLNEYYMINSQKLPPVEPF